jgi:hypothetical protein
MSNQLTVLHSLRCIGFAGLARVTAATGLDESTVESELIDLAVAGLVTHTAGDFGGWGLTEAGRATDAEWIAEELATAGTRTAVARAFDDFLVLNPELLDLCTAWQLDRNPRVLDLLAGFDRRAGVVCADLSSALPRFERYRVRLADALARVRAGAHDYVTDNLESYHVVWFQLHEDLLATLGIPR